MVIINVFLVLSCLLFGFHFVTRRFLNPYKLIFVFGKKGSGKSTVLSKLAYQALKSGKSVYSTENLRFKFKNGIRETIVFNPRQIYDIRFPENSLILIDEVSLIWDNRNFKQMDTKVVEWFRYQRHYKVRTYLFSQTFDIDKKLRDLADEMYLVSKYFRVFSVARRMIRKPIIVHPSADAPARIDEDIIEDNFFQKLFGGCIVAFIPHWAKVFDSFKKPEVAPLPFSATAHEVRYGE